MVVGPEKPLTPGGGIGHPSIFWERGPTYRHIFQIQRGFSIQPYQKRGQSHIFTYFRIQRCFFPCPENSESNTSERFTMSGVGGGGRMRSFGLKRIAMRDHLQASFIKNLPRCCLKLVPSRKERVGSVPHIDIFSVSAGIFHPAGHPIHY